MVLIFTKINAVRVFLDIVLLESSGSLLPNIKGSREKSGSPEVLLFLPLDASVTESLSSLLWGFEILDDVQRVSDLKSFTQPRAIWV